MSGDIGSSPEMEMFNKFKSGREFRRLTEGEDAEIQDFDLNSSEKLHELRERIYRDVPPPYRREIFQDKNPQSLTLSKWLIGAALIDRQNYFEYKEKHPIKVDCRSGPVTRNSYAPLPKARGTIRC